MDWPTLERTIEIGRRDMTAVLDAVSACFGDVVHGAHSQDLVSVLDG
jgi:hypothetical protein